MLLYTTTDLQEKGDHEKNYKEHLTMADQAYKEKREDKKRSLQNENVTFFSFDLEKCLATPRLQNNMLFYKRSLWTYNLTIYSCTKKQKHPICYIWDESIGGRGGEEIASCLRNYILSLPPDISEINIFSDYCSGQTRTIYVTTMLSVLVYDFNRNGRTLVINHKFLEPGHTHQEADTIHGAIEKVKKHTTAKIEIPRDWANLIRMVPRNPPIQVIEMQQTDFFNFKRVLIHQYVHRKIITEQEPVNWLQIKWLQYRTDSLSKVYYKTFYTPTELLRY
ncbi:unnamed protein product [Psylliodes chrysocephalus]|uniref:Uncharacterized protein n=1 Tax=Psylliodes chrysocephalus TaxID=3402493 RepID=A0A9P0D4Z9_9CUCU|nr:unnamed protein product [Psylliodes chrysocephala]